MSDLTNRELGMLMKLNHRAKAALSESKKNWVVFCKCAQEIHDLKLYRDAGTWEEFCKKHYGITARHVDRKLEAWAVAQQLTQENQTRGSENPPSIKAALALSKVEPEKRAQVLEEAKKSGAVTAPSVEAAAKKVIDADATPVDETGCKIPKEAQPFWDRRQEIQDLMTTVSKVKVAVEKAHGANDPMFTKIGNGLIADLTKAYTGLSQAKPYAVCTQCQGRFAHMKGCGLCGNTGLISKYLYDTVSRKEVKDMRAHA